MAGLIWLLWPSLAAPRTAKASATPPPDSAEDAQARAILGVGPRATESDIRAAYRAKMRRAHPDQGGAHNEAARLTAARDRLLKKLGGR
ncbi:DnaJ domain-containing protein [Vitreimonas flagellata]|uniref:DnaJ domain-containing protein n=1 Tax=Vitreimonas flagellata TaxID=2560861 RepID=UPI003B831091